MFHFVGYMGLAGTWSPSQRPQEFPRATLIQAREVRSNMRRGQAKAPLCTHPIWDRTQSVYWSEICHTRDQACTNSSLQKLHISTLSKDGVPSAA